LQDVSPKPSETPTEQPSHVPTENPTEHLTAVPTTLSAVADPVLPQLPEPSKREEEAQVLARAPLHALMSAFGRGSR
jgi:hypothetical protein